MKFIEYLDSHTEVSPSGTGVKTFTTGSLPECETGQVCGVEMYRVSILRHRGPSPKTNLLVEEREFN